ncbi:Rieske (2Fe-2S) protein [Streptomyces chryseus]|uniref:Cytochrome bc1 complex Rieske iron-sulfur subunit n=1 Tax=Streptomyces chryseus TaxID=68186 RepID=A0ABQ3DRB8_9ACTN|nr:Rieske (2Fe-2S) protein [Streptomyces chryseus]GHB12925.1 iron-sulfur protein [Streptomyces chryseus]
MTGSQETGRLFGRRTVVAAVGAAGVAAALTACGGSDSDSPYGTAAEKPAGGEAEAGGGEAGAGGGEAGAGGGEAGAGGGAVLAKTADIPEGGGKVFADQGVVVTQPAAGQFKAFSSKCTHQGCAVKEVANGMINCPCHGSMFDATDGTVKGGPAKQPLPAAAIKVEGDSITLA